MRDISDCGVYRIEGPAFISFSGGRTSGYMLYRVLDAWGGALPDDVRVIFTNTGKERAETLDFVRDCAEHWDVKVHWLEYRFRDGKTATEEVCYKTASRAGEPYEMAIARKKALPNPVARWCTTELKIVPMQRFAKSLGWKYFADVIGLRADEPHRVARAKRRNESSKNVWDVVMPLAEDGISKREVADYWRRSNFNLALPNINGTTPAGNCDLCFLKSAAIISGLMRQTPDLADWWVEQETKRLGSAAAFRKFRIDRPDYAAMRDAVLDQRGFDFGDLDEMSDCFCTE